MNKPISPIDNEITWIFNDHDAVKNAIKKGINNALLKHKKRGFPVCKWRNNQVVWIKPEDIKIS